MRMEGAEWERVKVDCWKCRRLVPGGDLMFRLKTNSADYHEK